MNSLPFRHLALMASVGQHPWESGLDSIECMDGASLET